ncbi:MAG: mannosyltransferase, partial [Bacteroidota bacterium]
IYMLKKWNHDAKKSNKKVIYSALSFALSIASKLLPLMFLPLLIKRLGWQKSLLYFSIVGSTVLLLFLPLISGAFLQNFGNSLDLYFRKFEFNASIYYLIRWIGFQIKGFNLIAKIGPALALGTLIGISALSLYERKPKIDRLPLMMLFAICIYLSFTTTVHPWYVSLPLVLCCFTNFRFPVLWSGLIFLTYINYSYTSYQENLWVVGLEYVLVWVFFIFELKQSHISSSNNS